MGVQIDRVGRGDECGGGFIFSVSSVVLWGGGFVPAEGAPAVSAAALVLCVVGEGWEAACDFAFFFA